jgi:SAM-dependent methyltransferase
MSQILKLSQNILMRALAFIQGRTTPSYFVQESPTPANMVQLFEGGWASDLPIAGVSSGGSTLFNDDRIQWFLSRIGGVEGKQVLELGPLEGGHTYMLEKAGAKRIVAVEANGQAWLKCLAVKETFELSHSTFLLGDCLRYLETSPETFDVAIVCGILYHLRDPQKLFPMLYKVCKGPIFLWTMAWSQDIEKNHPRLHRKFVSARTVKLSSGEIITLHCHKYFRMFASHFWGGNNSYAEWMSREDIIASAESAGYQVQEVAFDEPNHQNGPALALLLVPV